MGAWPLGSPFGRSLGGVRFRHTLVTAMVSASFLQKVTLLIMHDCINK